MLYTNYDCDLNYTPINKYFINIRCHCVVCTIYYYDIFFFFCIVVGDMAVASSAEDQLPGENRDYPVCISSFETVRLNPIHLTYTQSTHVHFHMPSRLNILLLCDNFLAIPLILLFLLAYYFCIIIYGYTLLYLIL